MVTREPAPLITAEIELADVWPEVSRALRGYLRARGSSPQDAEDVLQECALRVLHARPTFIDAPDLVRWCIPVVRNLTVDLYRRDRRETLVDRIPDEAGRGDLADDVSHSLELGRVLRALQQLRPADRDAIVSHVQQDAIDGLDRKTAVRLNVQRHRARQRLLARLAAVLGVCWASLRRGARITAPAMLPAALALGVVAGPLTGLHPGGATIRPDRAVPNGQLVADTHRDRMAPPVRSTGQLASVRPRTSRAADAPSKAVVASATAPTGQTVGVRSYRHDAGAPIACVQDGTGRPSLCVESLDQSASSTRASVSLTR